MRHRCSRPFGPELLALLAGLSPKEWLLSTACPGGPVMAAPSVRIGRSPGIAVIASG